MLLTREGTTLCPCSFASEEHQAIKNISIKAFKTYYAGLAIVGAESHVRHGIVAPTFLVSNKLLRRFKGKADDLRRDTHIALVGTKQKRGPFRV